MNLARVARYVLNCFWLVVPVLAISLLFTGNLPAQFQEDVFWHDIPAIIAIPENVSRFVVLLLPLLMPLGFGSQRQKLGWAVYLAGLLAYVGAWLMLIALPESGWSTSILGQTAPAWTPAIWLAGIGLIGERFYFNLGPLKPWLFFVAAAIFLVFHNAHTLTVVLRP